MPKKKSLPQNGQNVKKHKQKLKEIAFLYQDAKRTTVCMAEGTLYNEIKGTKWLVKSFSMQTIPTPQLHLGLFSLSHCTKSREKEKLLHINCVSFKNFGKLM
jgi:hypothetical protein